LIGTIAAYSLFPQISISEIQIHDIAEDTKLVVDDDMDVIDAKGATILLFWRQRLINHLSTFFEGTPLHNLILVATPFLFTLLEYFCVAHFRSTKQRMGSIVPQRILAYIQENPGCSQKQLIAELMTSRGSICYHLHKLKSTGKLTQISRNGSTLYYLAGAETREQFEQTLFQLLARKKSGKFLQVLYEHPHANRTELAEFLDLSPETLRWYLRRYAEEDIVSVEMVGTEYHYSFTSEAEHIYEHLRHTKKQEPWYHKF
ncbi:MAG: winged helix-turn-helix transcriptional regulator, partial [Methanocalculaceae archaeon]|nr:winged helix-turn-helix transcriptional regulator [Methanocalculaceae archaeon]